MLLKVLLVVCLPVLIAAKCGDWTDCNTCTKNKDAGLDCRWCAMDNSCHNPGSEDCYGNQTITFPYDCPAPPANGFEYSDSFARTKMLPIMAAAHATNPGLCLKNAFANATLRRQLNVRCDSQKQDTCSGYTGVSHTDQACIVSFRGTVGDQQLIQEALGSIFKEKKSFIGGGKVDAYFYNAFYALWNAGMRNDLLSCKNENPGYKLWVAGHSLGGAIASVCASAVVATSMWNGDDVRMMTIGQPRTGDMAYAEAHDAMLKYSYRVVHQDDMVPHIPPKMPNNWFDSFYHHRYEIWYNNDMTGNSFQLCDRSESPLCSDKQTDLSWDHHTHYFGHDVSAWGDSGCLPSVESKKEVAPRKIFNRIMQNHN